MTDTTQTTAQKVDEMAETLLNNHRFTTVQQAKEHIFETKPELAAAVREETETARVAGLRAADEAKKRVVLVGPAAEVELEAEKLLKAGVVKTRQQAKAHIFETRPKLAERIREQRA